MYDANTGAAETRSLDTSLAIASSSPIAWTPDGRSVLVTLRADGWAERAQNAFYGLTGAAVPLILKAMRQDPALGSGVIVTTFTDAFAFFAFLGIATLMLDRF